MIPDVIQQGLDERFKQKGLKGLIIHSATALSGGCINNSYKIETTEGSFFLKYNLAKNYPGMFETESLGLQLLRDTKAIRIPEPLMVSSAGDYTFILQEFILQSTYSPDFWQDFGRQLARLHKHSHTIFGLDHDNFIGSLPQSNLPHGDWVSFFIEERLDRQLERALDQGKVSRSLAKDFTSLYKRLPDLVPTEPASLLHGDLWSGNFITDEKGKPCLIDPAVYYGHREVDLAMTKLFGGFSVSFYDAYNEEFKLEPGWRERIDLFNLYPLLVHLNLFGGGYLTSIEATLRRL